MESSPNTKRIPLIVDSNFDFIDAMRNDPLCKSLPAVLTESGKTAQLALSNTSQPISSVYVNLNLANGYGYSIIRFAHRYRPATPIFILLDEGEKALDPKTIRQLGVQQVLQKPVSYSKLLEASIHSHCLRSRKSLEKQHSGTGA